MSGTVVVGIGNPCRRDDGAGWAVVERLRSRLKNGEAELVECGCGGLRLMDRLVGFERAFLVDAWVSGGAAGEVREIECGACAEGLAETANTASGHDGTLGEALRVGQLLGLPLPAEIRVWGIEAGSLEEFVEELTPEVERGVERVVARIEGLLRTGSAS